jgi:hypothetical protein
VIEKRQQPGTSNQELYRARRDCALGGSCPGTEKPPENQGFRPIFAENVGISRCFLGGSRKRRANVFMLSQIGNPRRNPVAQNTLSRYATDDERCKLDGHQWVFGHFGRSERRKSLQISTCTFQPVRPLVPGSARGSDGDPRRSTEVVLNEQALPVASMKSSRSRDARSVMRAKTKLEAMTAVAVLASRAARVVAFRSNLTPCGWGVPETLRGHQ